MNCPFCGTSMKKGTVCGDGRIPVRWSPQGERLGLFDQLSNAFTGIGIIKNAKYSAGKFGISADYCERCGKVIFDAKIGK